MNSEIPMTKKGTPVKLKKDGTPSLAGRWKRGGNSKKSAKKKPAKKKQKAESGLFIYWKDKKSDMFLEVDSYESAESEAQELFKQYPKLESVFLMQPIKRYSTPSVVVTDL